MGDRVQIQARITPRQHELLRRRSVNESLSIQTVLSAAVNAYILGDLRVLPNGRYHVQAPAAPVSRDDRVRLRAPTVDQPDRVVVLEQAPADRRVPWGTQDVAEHIERKAGKRISQRMMRTLLAHLEETGRVEPRSGRYWRFPLGADDPNVAAVRIAVDDGTYERLAREGIQQAQEEAQG